MRSCPAALEMEWSTPHILLLPAHQWKTVLGKFNVRIRCRRVPKHARYEDMRNSSTVPRYHTSTRACPVASGTSLNCRAKFRCEKALSLGLEIERKNCHEELFCCCPSRIRGEICPIASGAPEKLAENTYNVRTHLSGPSDMRT